MNISMNISMNIVKCTSSFISCWQNSIFQRKRNITSCK